jgi:hypothetical protein
MVYIFLHPNANTKAVKRRWSIEDTETYNQDDKSTKNPFLGLPPLPADSSLEVSLTTSPEFEVKKAENANDKDTQGNYRCPQCSFPCWLCHVVEASREPDSKSSNEDEYYQPEGMSVPQSVGPSNKRKRNDGLRYLGPKDERFEMYILRPSGVRVRPQINHLLPEGLPDASIQEDPSIASQVYLKINHSTAIQVSDQFNYYHWRKYDETSLKEIVTKWLAPFDNYVDPSGPKAVVSLRRDKWKPRKEGPIVPTEPPHCIFTYDWDIEPDITYMVALNFFDEGLRQAVQKPGLDWLLAEPVGICPYLTIELKCAEKTGKDSDARNQISAASVVWLYQRKKLKDELHLSDFSDLRHYSIVINSMQFQIWVTKFDGKEYLVQMIDANTLMLPEGVEHYVKWSNAIHKWGLGSNANSFKRDVEALLGISNEAT